MPIRDLPCQPPSLIAQNIAAEHMLRRLPSLPIVSSKLLAMMGRPDVDFHEIGNLIVSDAVLTGELLRMSNSALFGMRTEIRSILHALTVLGTDRVKGLVCTVALRNYLGNALQIPALKRCWRHNLATAVTCWEIANWVRRDGGEAYTAGILHDVGRVGLIAVDPATYLQLLEEATTRGEDLSKLERQAYGIDHAVAGEWLATAWDLSPAISNAIRDHHLPLNSAHDDLTGLLHYGCRIADGLGFSAHEMHTSTSSDSPVEEFLGHLSGLEKERLTVNVRDLQTLIIARVKCLEL